MRKYFIVFFFCLSFASESYSQKNFSDYSYIVVPDLYEFLSEKDKYQLNSLTKFLFNKHGFNAYFPDELPNVRRCGGLYADVDLESGFIYTKMSVIIKDCEGTELYRSPQGKSKLKEYKKAYQQSLRKAFENVGRLNVNQKDIVMDDEASGSTSTILKLKPMGRIHLRQKCQNLLTYRNRDFQVIPVKANLFCCVKHLKVIPYMKNLPRPKMDYYLLGN